ncbi:hypothetical protein PAAG_12538 [Paracoccidioides lutzii Pb01]|uniref:Uncharacterized protein n=1 Tax=Paracoccidioides lutzii (strain ATCC MYA-826 / Pb01) TaxID=502779 RepID=A0A0A2V3T4_PARBA|nr:hypothetical protein PAAG_12538 [Paracoccidioides lutzii Pb01]KGQ00810.1 hypothetical protein PAAG_12538 [Paracoccidioides lutzii Pb01]
MRYLGKEAEADVDEGGLLGEQGVGRWSCFCRRGGLWYRSNECKQGRLYYWPANGQNQCAEAQPTWEMTLSCSLAICLPWGEQPRAAARTRDHVGAGGGQCGQNGQNGQNGETGETGKKWFRGQEALLYGGQHQEPRRLCMLGSNNGRSQQQQRQHHPQWEKKTER